MLHANSLQQIKAVDQQQQKNLINSWKLKTSLLNEQWSRQNVCMRVCVCFKEVAEE